MNKIFELEERLKQYEQEARKAKEIALRKLQNYSEPTEALTPKEVLRRELLRHHTRTLLLDEIREWMNELKGIRLYQLYAEDDDGNVVCHRVRQYMTEKEAEEVNATYAANRERLRWKPIDLFEEDETDV